MSSPSPVVSPAVAAAEQRARALLAQEKWRQARDELKPLFKADCGRFLPLLIEANLGLARKMLASGQASEARQVLNYLATIAPAGHLRAFELELAMKSGTAEQSLPKYVAALADASVALSEVERVRLADNVVLAFQPVAATDPAQARIAAELRAIHDGLQAVAETNWSKVSESLRLVSHRSVFSHWAVFIKGITAFHAGEADKAGKLLRSLPADSVPAKAGQAYLLLAAASPASDASQPAPPAPVSDAVTTAVCRLTGAGGVSGILVRAEKLWREGKHAESYRIVRDGVAEFPSQGLDWSGALTEFYFKSPHGMAEHDWAGFLNYFTRLIDRNQLKNRVETMLVYRMLSLVGQAAVAAADELREDWETFLDEHKALHGTNPRLASLAYGWLGEQLSRTRLSRGFFSGPPLLRDPAGAVEVLCRSIELDPSNLAAHLQLGAVYGALKKNSERNRLLDTMTARFPDDKQVLVRAAEGCIERKAFGKGLDYLSRARQLDQLDPRIPELMAAALFDQARQCFQQRRPDKARQVFAQAEEWLTDKPGDFPRSRWTRLVRHGVMERLWGDLAKGDALLAQARERAPSRVAQLFFAHLAHRVYAKTYRCESPFLAELKQALRGAPRLGDIGRLLHIVEYWHTAAEEIRTYDEEQLIANSIAATVGQPFSRAEAEDVIGQVGDKPEFARPLGKLVKKFLRADPLDPQARLWQIEIRGPWTFGSTDDRAELQSILDEAARRHDEASMRKARQVLRDLDHPAPMPNPFGPNFAGPKFEADEDEDDDDFDDDGGPPPPKLPPGMLDEFAELIEAMRVAPDSALRKLRKKAAREGMPDFVFDALVATLKDSTPPPASPKPSLPPRPKPPRPEPPTRDPNQMDLF